VYLGAGPIQFTKEKKFSRKVAKLAKKCQVLWDYSETGFLGVLCG